MTDSRSIDNPQHIVKVDLRKAATSLITSFVIMLSGVAAKNAISLESTNLVSFALDNAIHNPSSGKVDADFSNYINIPAGKTAELHDSLVTEYSGGEVILCTVDKDGNKYSLPALLPHQTEVQSYKTYIIQRVGEKNNENKTGVENISLNEVKVRQADSINSDRVMKEANAKAQNGESNVIIVYDLNKKEDPLNAFYFIKEGDKVKTFSVKMPALNKL